MSEIYHIARALKQNPTTPAVLATLVEIEGSSYRRQGARRLIPRQGEALGSISGGCLEADLDERARRLMNSVNNFELVIYDTSAENDLLWGTGTGCHGVIKILLEKVTASSPWVEPVLDAHAARHNLDVLVEFKGNKENRGTRVLGSGVSSFDEGFRHVVLPPIQLVIFGAGDDAMPLCELAHTLGWEKKISDPRAKLLTKSRFPHADALVPNPAESAATAFNWDDQTAAVVMTHRYLFDLPLLKTLLPLNLPFLGLLGPKARGERLLRDIGLAPDAADLHNPVGLDLGGDGAEAVALAIVAEIQAKFNQRSGTPLRNRTQPIHRDV